MSYNFKLKDVAIYGAPQLRSSKKIATGIRASYGGDGGKHRGELQGRRILLKIYYRNYDNLYDREFIEFGFDGGDFFFFGCNQAALCEFVVADGAFVEIDEAE